jgi:glutathione synthase/RimK-type ligase-like ATP-grasp enzyme
MILIIAPENDFHAKAVQHSARQFGNDAVIFDAASFPSNAKLSIKIDQWDINNGKIHISSKDVTGLWWRRPGNHEVSPRIADRDAARFVQNESVNAFDVIAFWDGYKIMNSPSAEMRANRKMYQLKTADKIGFKVPDTIITNDASAVSLFMGRSNNDIIYKTLTSPSSYFAETRRYKDVDVRRNGDIELSPLIFQAEVDTCEALRITIVDQTIFVAKIVLNNKNAEGHPDWRLDQSATCEIAYLDVTHQGMLLKLMDELGLSYATVDLLRDKNGNIWFLEVNTSGQYLFVEIDTGLKISSQIARFLS